MGFDLAQLQLMPALGKFVEAIGQQMSGTNATYNGNVQLPSFLGAAAVAQQNQSAQSNTGFQQLTSFMGQSQAVTAAGAVQLIATQARMKAIAATATAKRFQVWPTGVVTPGPEQIAECAAHWSTWGPARLKQYWAQANAYTASINGQLTQAGALDQQIAGALIKVVTDTLGGFLQKKLTGDGGSAGLPVTPAAPGTVPGTGSRPVTLPAFTGGGADLAGGAGGLGGTVPAGAGLAGAGGFAGAGGVGGAGSGGFSPASINGSVNAAGAVSLAGGAAGTAGALGLGAAPATGAVAGTRAGMAGGMMPMTGAGAHRAAGGERAASTWLNEDDDPWGADGDAPTGVVG
ncbi:hypothetical protein [Virgisporangium ochraceum]|nr:hypothetical protein [Virgisporangium ochraceum]